MIYLRSLLLVLSLLGLFGWIKIKLRIDTELIPILVFSLIGTAMFLAGILNIMKLATILIVAVGVFGFLRYSLIIRERRFYISQAFFICLCLVSYALLKDMMFIHYDNFSHWGLVAREILEQNAFPNFKSELIQFQSYTTGSAGFIYFICKVLGLQTEGAMAFAQSLLNIAAIYSMFVLIDKKKYLLGLVLSLFGIYLLIANILPYDLLVDTILTSMGLAIVVAIMKYQHDLHRAMLVILPLAIFLTSIKFSGIFFVLSGVLLLVFVFRRSFSLWELVKSVSFILIGVLSVTYLWRAHVSYVYSAAKQSKHAVNLTSYLMQFVKKGQDKNLEIVKNFMSRIFSFNNSSLYIYIGALVIGLLTYLYIAKSTRDFIVYLKFLCVTLAIYVSYQAMLLATYIFSMPYEEAKGLDSYDRYDITITVYLLGIILVYIISHIKEYSSKQSLLLMLSIVTLLVIIWPRHLFSEQSLKDWTHKQSVRNQLDHALETKQLEAKRATVISIEEAQLTEGYAWYVARFALKTDYVNIVTSKSEFENQSKILQSLRLKP